VRDGARRCQRCRSALCPTIALVGHKRSCVWQCEISQTTTLLPLPQACRAATLRRPVHPARDSTFYRCQSKSAKTSTQCHTTGSHASCRRSPVSTTLETSRQSNSPRKPGLLTLLTWRVTVWHPDCWLACCNLLLSALGVGCILSQVVYPSATTRDASNGMQVAEAASLCQALWTRPGLEPQDRCGIISLVIPHLFPVGLYPC
jgi:hypothetical protein